MIKQITIHNFRGIKDMSLMIGRNVSIIMGQNGLGKSTLLNAISWFFTDVLLTDKWGVGENNIESISPKDLMKGQKTWVEITFETGTTYRKTYVTEYDKYDKVSGHNTEGTINGVKCKNKKSFVAELMNEINWIPRFKTINEARLFSDPLYALQKIRPEELRNFLIELGAVVTNEEVYALGHEILREYEAKYKGNFHLMKKDLKEKILNLKYLVKKDEELLATVADVTPFNPIRLEELESKKRGLIETKARLSDLDLEHQLQQIDYKIEKLGLNRKQRIAAHQTEIDKKLMDLRIRLSMEQANLEGKRIKSTFDLKNQESSLSSSIASIDRDIDSYKRSLEDAKDTLYKNVQLGKGANKQKTDLALQLTQVMEKEYTHLATCPHCNTTFAPNETEHADFENNKNEQIQELKSRIEQAEKTALSCKTKCDEMQIRITKINEELEKLYQEKKRKVDALLDIQKQISQVNNSLTSTKEELDLASEIKSLELQRMTVDTRDIDAEIDALMNEKEQLKQNSELTLNVKFNEIENEIFGLTEPINQEYAHKSKWADKQEWTERLRLDRETLNNEESLLCEVNAFLKDYMKLLNQRATNLTGINFVMQEENLSNDNMRDVCYALIDGVAFSEVNTSEKYAIGIKFIERIKDIVTSNLNAPRNAFPILADRLEGFDFIEKIKGGIARVKIEDEKGNVIGYREYGPFEPITKIEQLICSVVTTDDEITII